MCFCDIVLYNPDPCVGAQIGLESETYDVLESAGSVAVCAILSVEYCSPSFPLTLIFSTFDYSAGNTSCSLFDNYFSLSSLSRFSFRFC